MFTNHREITSKVCGWRLLVFKGIILCKDKDQQRNVQLQGRYCRYDEEGLGYSHQIQSTLHWRKRLLLLSESWIGLSQDGIVPLWDRSMSAFREQRQKERCWYVSVGEEMEGLVC